MRNDYWTLSERERSGLTSEDVEKFIAFELMTAGVLTPTPLVLVEQPDAPEPDGAVYVAQCGYQHAEVAFATPEEAAASVVGSLGQVKTEKLGDWRHGVSVSTVKPFDIAPPCELVRKILIYSPELIASTKEQLGRASEAQSENGRRKLAFEEESKKVDEALKGMWSDWHECCARAAEVAKVNATMKHYTAMAKGDVEIARGFLLKAFDKETIEEAEVW